MRKTTIIFTVAFIIVSSLSVSAASSTPKLVIWNIINFVEGVNRTEKEIAETFARKHNITVSMELMTYGELPTKLATAVETKAMPDILLITEGFLPRYAGADVFMDVTDLADEIGRTYGGWLGSVREVSRFGGKTLMVPYTASANVWYFRKDLLDDAGLAIPTHITDLELIAKKRSSFDTVLYPLGLCLSRNWDGQSLIREILWGFGGSEQDKAGNITFDSRETRAAFQFITDLAIKYNAVPPDAVTWDGAANNVAFETGRAVVIYNYGSCAWALRAKNNPIAKSTVLTPPLVGPTGTRNGTMGVYGWAIAKGTKYPDIAKELIKAFYDKEKYIEAQLSPGSGQIPILESFASHPIFKKPDQQPFLEAARYVRNLGWPGPMNRFAIEVYGNYVMEDMLARMIVDKWDISKAMNEAMQKIKKIAEAIK